MSEIPIIGRFFRGKRRPNPPVWEEDDSNLIQTQAPRVDRKTVMDRISSGNSISGVKEGEMRTATQDLLEELLEDQITRGQGRKFLREGGKVVIGGVNSHVAYARAAEMIPEDAGSIEADTIDGVRVLMIKGGSFGLGIPDKNANRPETMRLLRETAPNIDFKED